MTLANEVGVVSMGMPLGWATCLWLADTTADAMDVAATAVTTLRTGFMVNDILCVEYVCPSDDSPEEVV